MRTKMCSSYHHIHTNPSGGYNPSESSPKIPKLNHVSAVPDVVYVVAVGAVLGLLSSVNYTVAIYYVVGNQDNSDAPLPTESPSTYVDLEATAKNERERLEELLKSKGMQDGSYPRFTVDVKGQKEVQVSKQGSFTTEELELLAFALQTAGPN